MAAGNGTGKKTLAQVIRIILLGAVVLGFMSIAAVTGTPGMKWASNASDKQNVSNPAEPAQQRQTEQALSAILFVNELSCPCTREQCRAAEAIVQTLKEDFSGRARFETIDYELQNEKAKPLLQKFNAFMIPVLVVLDQEDQMLWRCEDFSDESAIRACLDEIIQKAEPRDESSP